MKKLSLVSIVIFMLVIQLSCDYLTSSNLDIRKSRVISVEMVSVTEEKISLIAKAEWSNGCGRFSSVSSLLEDNIYTITVYGEQEKDAVCTMAFIEFDAHIEVNTDGKGDYIFKFWTSDITTLDTTFSIQFK